MKVNECMSSKVCFCSPEATIKDVAKLMCDNHVGCIPVCDKNQAVVGILTDRDIILRSIACDKDVCNTPVSDIMTTKVCCCTPETSIEQITLAVLSIPCSSTILIFLLSIYPPK